MVSRFRKKPTTVEAVQWFKMGDHPGVVKMLDTAEGEETHSDEKEDAWGKFASVFHALSTPEGNRRVNPGDWIVSDSNGAQYPCNPEIFAVDYEPEDAGPAKGGVQEILDLAGRGPDERVTVVRIPAQTGLDPIAIYFEDYGPGSGRMTVACFGDAWTAAWGAMGDRSVQEFVTQSDANYLADSFLQLCGGNGRHRIYTDRIARAIIGHLAPTQPKDSGNE